MKSLIYLALKSVKLMHRRNRITTKVKLKSLRFCGFFIYIIRKMNKVKQKIKNILNSTNLAKK